ncbi:hypothetical protein PHMEG_00017600, partial [Phytophthora megakarya]
CRSVLLSIQWQVWQQEQTTVKPIGISKLTNKLWWIQGRRSRVVVAEKEEERQWREVLQIEKDTNGISWKS